MIEYKIKWLALKKLRLFSNFLTTALSFCHFYSLLRDIYSIQCYIETFVKVASMKNAHFSPSQMHFYTKFTLQNEYHNRKFLLEQFTRIEGRVIRCKSNGIFEDFQWVISIIISNTAIADKNIINSMRDKK